MEAEPIEEVPRPQTRRGRVRAFVIESRNELLRVSWPSAREVYATTVVVIVFTLAMVVYIGVIDFALDWLQLWLRRRF
jgi:preprotein translocase SecE subunit